MPKKKTPAKSSGKQKAKSPPAKAKSPPPSKAKDLDSSESQEKDIVTTKSFSSTTSTRKGTYSQSREEYQVLPRFKIPRLSWDDVAIDLDDAESFDSDLDTHVENFGPTYQALERRDKQYVIANIQNMLNSVRGGGVVDYLQSFLLFVYLTYAAALVHLLLCFSYNFLRLK